MSGQQQQGYQQQAHGGHQLSPVYEQTCVLGDLERDQLPGLSQELRLEFAHLNEDDRYNVTTITMWFHYAYWKDLWLKQWPSSSLDGNKTWEELVQAESQFRYDFERNNYPALHQVAKDEYNGIDEETKRNPEFGPVVRSYVVAYNNFLKCSTSRPEPEPTWSGQSSQAYVQAQPQSYQQQVNQQQGYQQQSYQQQGYQQQGYEHEGYQNEHYDEEEEEEETQEMSQVVPLVWRGHQ